MRGGWRELDANANEALGRHYDRTGWQPVYSDMPFAAMLRAEDDGLGESEIGDYEIQRLAEINRTRIELGVQKWDG